MTVRIVADENMPDIEAWFSSVTHHITRKPGRTLTRADLSEADVLLVRSVTQVNESLLAQTPVKFVGSATIGTDHVDLAYLQQRNIPFHYAPGSNAQSVADWLLSVMSRLHLDHDLCWWQKTIGIVGVGNVGKTVLRSLQSAGCRILLCDPPRAEQGSLPEHLPLDSLLQQADIVCFHTPHTRSGAHATENLMTDARLQQMRPGSWLINAGRGPVVNRDDLVWHCHNRDIHAVLDVWPAEPTVDDGLLSTVELASPHVAGYSLEGKSLGTRMLAEALQDWAGWPALRGPALPRPPRLDARLYQQDDVSRWASELILAVYDPARDTVAMRASLQGGVVPPALFDALRKEYPTRRELNSVTVSGAPDALANWLERLGFQLA